MNPGDVLLVRGNGRFSTLLTTAQKPFYSGVKSSHVLVSLAEGSFVHATMDGGVEIVFFDEVLPKIEPSWRAVRLKVLSESEQEEVMKAAIYYFHQAYNSKYFHIETEHSSFCSELVAKIYRKAGVKILGGKAPSKTIPADFDRACDCQEDWEEVTEELEAVFDKMQESIDEYKLGFSIMLSAIEKRRLSLKLNSQILSGMEEAMDAGAISEELFENAKERENDFLSKKSISFWDEE
ncbi:YiiX/YebB-like N1pC/P60 family cysteine hydrolase [Congregibacter variabilis]|uniref:YiiX/YebB-like N1pC/P60 family cysteine hydrolase n=1 Tax=Congregibacter variabilis TaxID=3081200 RepID=A0ABZ0I4D8_9GAMM|nr:YiiX/YebB-like N1pC/P60 family cysteine hydrolase [Congregibacter sp. IMCC43200]